MEIRSTSGQDLEVFVDTILAAFGRFRDGPAEGAGNLWSAYEMDRNLLAVTSDGRPVGTAGAYSFELTLPGEIVAPAAGVTGVGVLPSHRRQGVLTAMMRRQITEFRARGEFLAVLLATEATIYGRFGYGPATYAQRLTVPRHRAGFAAPRGPVARPGRSSCCGARIAVRSWRRCTTGTVAGSPVRCRGRTGGGPMAPGSRRCPRRRGTSPCTGMRTGCPTGMSAMRSTTPTP
ncbi:hypothetical protein Aph02nite_47310 [Actinoplanes philippinensis]|uniref:Acetyltransferase (GNAT) domain-containing protein n=1 Tax=Actinoplanes philippinensis TaxID=35752 RepID=A0A1I2I012_9ACTN|nr:GNAT family N-acetyltransferase [Actinoplanes philippinensis]GIE78781.1 hypothetical protein Aph02nite_47310 [Actinoplanes philippinensis]SFF35582.1 Acetyltransferase (GNAT) domain-containing protein [Actinoplanes philippinensis]